MDSFFSELKATREARGVSLDEIADATLISAKMLEALERGDVGALPQAYIRAFVREYASVIGVDVNATLQEYDQWFKGRTPPPVQSTKTVDIQFPAEIPVQPRKDRVERMVPAFLKIGGAFVVLLMVDIVFWNVLEKEPSYPVKEIPFREIVKENEDRAGIRDTTALRNDSASIGSRADSTLTTAKPVAGTLPRVTIDKDSLTLVATTTDSVWIEIVIDDTIVREHFLFPKSTMMWKAKKEFWLSAVGNPSAIKFALNNKPIAIPIKHGFVTRDVRLTRDSLRTQ